ncbi:hypothetical protein PUR26_09700 [Streptomyces sp. SP18CS02]|nr:hypothetical protein [Streptomyces sp. SP18CS02]
MVYAEPMARAVVEPAVRDLMNRCGDGQGLSTTVAFGGDGFTLYAGVRVRRVATGQAEVSLACWVTNRDAARYLGGNPPSEDETRLRPEGTATPDGPLTTRVAGHLATRMNALGTPRPDSDGYLAVTVPLASP